MFFDSKRNLPQKRTHTKEWIQSLGHEITQAPTSKESTVTTMNVFSMQSTIVMLLSIKKRWHTYSEQTETTRDWFAVVLSEIWLEEIRGAHCVRWHSEKGLTAKQTEINEIRAAPSCTNHFNFRTIPNRMLSNLKGYRFCTYVALCGCLLLSTHIVNSRALCFREFTSTEAMLYDTGIYFATKMEVGTARWSGFFHPA